MTFTPFDVALASIAAPLPESSASTSNTVAPSVMAASACVCMVWALPCALLMMMSLDDMPAASNAFWRYGRSNVS